MSERIDGTMGDDVYQPDGSEIQEDTGPLEPEDTLDDRGIAEVLDEGYSPPERPLGVDEIGTTAAEQQAGLDCVWGAISIVAQRSSVIGLDAHIGIAEL